MKGVILAGGTGSRLDPLTRVTNKHLLPIYDKPMIYYPIMSLTKAGIKEIMIVTGDKSAGDLVRLLGNGKEFNANFTYAYQEGAGGIAEALYLCKRYAVLDNICVVLGDNIFDSNLIGAVSTFNKGARLFLSRVGKEARRFGVPTIIGGRITRITEKPDMPESPFAVTGIYMYDSRVFDFIEKCSPSRRGELEITDVNNYYIRDGSLDYEVLDGYWTDAGTFESLYNATKLVRENENRNT